MTRQREHDVDRIYDLLSRAGHKPLSTQGGSPPNGRRVEGVRPDDSIYRLVSNTEIPLDDAWYVLLAWPRKDAETTKVVDEAMARGDKPTVDRLGMTGKLGWFEFSCTTFDYERSWDEFPDEREEVEASYSSNELEQMRRAEVKYFFRCGTHPPHNGDFLCRVAKLVEFTSGGFLDIP
jgi:hypothetical protein